MVDKRNSALEARSESEAVRTRNEVQDGKNDSCCLLLLALSPQLAVSVMWIGYVIVYFSAINKISCGGIDLRNKLLTLKKNDGLGTEVTE